MPPKYYDEPNIKMANYHYTTYTKKRAQPIVNAVSTARELKGEELPLEGVSSGVEGLDALFYKTTLYRGKPKVVPLGGYPKYSVMNITGVPDTGKSLMAEQFAIQQAAEGKPTVFITAEAPAAYLLAGMRGRAAAMGYNFDDIEDLLIIIDAASSTTLRESIPSLLSTLDYAIEEYSAENVVIDSITGFYEAKEMAARQIVRQIFNFLKERKQTALLVSQKRSEHEFMSSEAAGGYAVSHIVDGTIVLSKELIGSRYAANLYKKPIGEMVRLFRIDGCRLTGHDTDVHVMEITKDGLVRIGPKLKDLLKEG